MKFKLEFENLRQIIKEKCKSKKVMYFPNPGNWGDGILRYATLKLFEDIDLEYEEIGYDYDKSYDGDVAIYGAGGAWCDIHPHGRIITENLLRDGFEVIVLPSTYAYKYHTDNTIFFRRDKFESKLNIKNSIFCPDMVFYLDSENLKRKKGRGIGYFFRTDIESSNKYKIPSTNYDISADGNEWSLPKPFFDEINKYSVVHTDRLHIAISACLLGKELHLYDGAYFKNLSLYLTSVLGNFDNVYFHEE